jgi:uncharacterized membrane protein YgdD (TMEM256/DUF423 family)
MGSKQWLMLGAISGFFGVALGAFGAHGLKDVLNAKAMQVYQTAVQYQMIHSLALLGLGILGSQNSFLNTQMAGMGFTLGIVLFSGSLYALALTDLKFLGAITPLGGVSFLVGWLGFAILAWKA